MVLLFSLGLTLKITNGKAVIISVRLFTLKAIGQTKLKNRLPFSKYV